MQGAPCSADTSWLHDKRFMQRQCRALGTGRSRSPQTRRPGAANAAHTKQPQPLCAAICSSTMGTCLRHGHCSASGAHQQGAGGRSLHEHRPKAWLLRGPMQCQILHQTALQTS